MHEQVTIGTQARIAGKAYECYNVQGDEHRFARINKNGQKLSHKNRENLLNLSAAQIDVFAALNSFELI